MKRFFLLLACGAWLLSVYGQDSLWIRYDDRFKANTIVKMLQADSFQVLNGSVKVNGANYQVPADKADLMFQEAGPPLE